MQDLALEQVSHGREADVWVRTHVHAGTGGKFRGTHVIEKDEWPHPLAALVRQRPAHREFSEIPCLGLY